MSVRVELALLSPRIPAEFCIQSRDRTVNNNGKSPDIEAFLGRPIRDLGLKLEDSPVERFVERLYRELEAKKLKKFRPVCYLTDEWGCPSGEPVIGIPFYLTNAKLAQLEKETNDLEDGREVMMYLRHEA